MTSVLLDTRVLTRLANSGDRLNPVAGRGVATLRVAGRPLSITSQNVIEFRAVATRPVAVNGLGFTAAQADAAAAAFESQFLFLPDHAAVYAAWKAVVQSLGVVGITVHDARLVAVCYVYGITHLMTFNVRHFQTLAQAAPGLIVLDPATI